MVEEEVEVTASPRVTLGDVAALAVAWGVGVAVVAVLFVAAAHESVSNWRRERGR